MPDQKPTLDYGRPKKSGWGCFIKIAAAIAVALLILACVLFYVIGLAQGYR